MRPERELIDMIRKLLTEDPEEMLELGRDDASARKLFEGIYVFNTDMMASSTDLLPGMSLENYARKCVVSNFSDLAAKGAKPIFFMASVGLPAEMEENNFISIIRGLERGSREYDAYFTGGDLGESKELILAGFSVGRIINRLVSRRGSKPGDVIVTTGTFGLTWLGFQHLLRGMSLPDRLRELAIKAVYEPKARVDEGILISNYASSSIDSSDGLYWSLKELSRASGYGFLVNKIPLDPTISKFIEKRKLDPLDVVFHGGEEYHIIFTVPREELPHLRAESSRKGLNFLEIGVVIEEPGVFIERNNEIIRVAEGGWEHFRSRSR